MFHHFQGLLPGSRNLRYPKTRVYGILLKKDALYISVLVSTKKFGKIWEGELEDLIEPEC